MSFAGANKDGTKDTKLSGTTTAENSYRHMTSSDDVAIDAASTMSPPPMSIWNGTLRFGLELASLVGMGHFCYTVVPVVPPLAAVVVPCAAAVAWGTFNVPHDPSRGGGAPVRVAGSTRLAIEAVILGGGGVSLFYWNPVAGGIFFAATTAHYVSYYKRIQWLLQQRL